ncbi:hypothetical protein [Enterococcus sp. 5H]|uniref:hypothetical protein n=1 Tax=Enterococcus sp. 5H TaxID=1229490 RepID=UPI0023043C97|nr:hypothetical protein [Enterococcus sp. 5H]MDA9471974.1 hypothetical protein [Enterococcus sp. 5H]
MQKLVKVTTTFQNIWLIDLKDELFSEKNTILFGDTLRLSISKNDSYYFSESIGLTYDREIISKDLPTENEIAFFNYMKKAQEKMFSKTLANKYDIAKYIRSTTTEEPENDPKTK